MTVVRYMRDGGGAALLAEACTVDKHAADRMVTTTSASTGAVILLLDFVDICLLAASCGTFGCDCGKDFDLLTWLREHRGLGGKGGSAAKQAHNTATVHARQCFNITPRHLPPLPHLLHQATALLTHSHHRHRHCYCCHLTTLLQLLQLLLMLPCERPPAPPPVSLTAFAWCTRSIQSPHLCEEQHKPSREGPHSAANKTALTNCAYQFCELERTSQTCEDHPSTACESAAERRKSAQRCPRVQASALSSLQPLLRQCPSAAPLEG